MYQLGEDYIFPHPSNADKNGLVAYGGDLNPLRILEAYKSGIFPWFESDQKLMWWSPDPRMILYADKFKVSKSFKAFLKKSNYKVTFNKDFELVINSCANIKRINQKGTWITEGLIKSFIDLHEMGKAISVEVWEDDDIVGGLYGLDLDDVFCGESMFSKSSNASKIALYYLTKELRKNNYRFIDCQVPSDHLKSLGGEIISRSNFLDLL
ncbi:MAG: leucyl/phenylalanyl-tRNA--protein transferase [Flavobacteriaceae bacterium]|nr:leucyl/phenylalanyl-tRNA--protein transferase [Flavobacteriaceae bacterium]MBL6684932.1 leucyl/phenylalanyl-tRNA--protein transferase [Flavobacteriaceae bacterium]